MPNDRLYSVGDARAELHRILDQTKPARQALHRALGALRKVGEQSGFAGEADKAIEMLRRGALGEAAPPPAASPIPEAALEVDSTRCRACGLRYRGPRPCPACALADLQNRLYGIEESAPKWIQQLLLEARKENVGFYPLVLEKEMRVGDSASVELREQPQLTFRPQLLLLDEAWTDGGVVEEIYVGHESLRIGGGALPMSMFCPSKWADASLMAKARLHGRKVHPGEVVRLQVRVTKTGIFRAVLLGPADLGPHGAHPLPASLFLAAKAMIDDPPMFGDPSPLALYAHARELDRAPPSSAYGVMNARRRRILQRALQHGDGAQCAKLADAFESEGLPEQAAVLREAASARPNAPKDDPKIPAPLPHVAVMMGSEWLDPSCRLPTRARELPCPKCGSAQATRSHCPSCGWEVCKADVVAVSIEPHEGVERVRFLRPEAAPTTLAGFFGAVTSVTSQTFTLNGVPVGRIKQREVHDADVVAYSLPGDRVFIFKNRWGTVDASPGMVFPYKEFKVWRSECPERAKFLLDEEPVS